MLNRFGHGAQVKSQISGSRGASRGRVAQIWLPVYRSVSCQMVVMRLLRM